MSDNNRTTHRRKTEQDYHLLAESRNFAWVGEFPQSTKYKTIWKCSNGHEWEARYDDIRAGYGCPYCAGLARKTPYDYRRLADQRSLKWLGPEVPNNRTKTRWLCPKGHEFKMSYNQLTRGDNCSVCYRNRRKTADDYIELAKAKDIIWSGRYPKNTNLPTQWQCLNGHTWESTYSLMRDGKGCPYCSGLKPFTAGDYAETAAQFGLFWIGPMPANGSQHTNWQCQKGHIFRRPIILMKSESGRCPYCYDFINGSRVSQPQRDLCEMLDGELNHRVGDWTIDIALKIDGVLIACEFDSWFWHAHKLDRDAKRDEHLISQGWHILRVKTDRKLPTHNQLNASIARLVAGETYTEIVLDDWGKGPTFHDLD